MEEAIKERLTSRDIWIRGLYMVFFGFAYSLAELVIVLVAIFQFLAILIAGHANENALRLGNNLSKYVYQVFQFQTFNTESRPFPFADWPDEPLEDNVWKADGSQDRPAAREETDDALDVAAAEPDPAPGDGPAPGDDEPTELRP